ncbi:hypothetical protein V5O48_015847 [Marasmius crinis-equi]|uniref:Uncharacterized protein n=1 Tax=Marasmius crinis-equi TaxID=585013 RepID=A0ABR3ETD2_9AGAR
MSDFTAIFPNEILTRIITSTGPDTRHIHPYIYVNRTLFAVAVPVRYAKIQFEDYLVAHEAAAMFCTLSNGERARVYCSAPREVTLGSKDITPAWKYDRVFEMLKSFRGIISLRLWHLPSFPYDDLPNRISTLQHLRSVEMVCAINHDFLPQFHKGNLPAMFPPLTRLNVSNLKWYSLNGIQDQSICSLASISLLSTLRYFCADVASWTALGLGRWHARAVFPAGVVEILVIAGTKVSASDLTDEAWARGLFRALEQCRENLEILRVELPHETRASVEQRISLPRLSVFVGPEGLPCCFELAGPLSVFWITSSGRKPDTWEQVWSTLENPASIRMLRVGIWNTKTLDVANVLHRLPQLEEIAFFTRSKLPKHDLMALGQAFRQCNRLWSVSIIGPSGAEYSDGTVTEIATAWRAQANRIASVRLNVTEKYHLQFDWDTQRFMWGIKSIAFLKESKHAVLPSRMKPCVELIADSYAHSNGGTYTQIDTEYNSPLQFDDNLPTTYPYADASISEEGDVEEEE